MRTEMKRPVYILGGLAGMIGGALLVAWNLVHTSAGGGVTAGAQPVAFYSTFVTGLAVALVSGCFLWLLLWPRK